MLITGIPIPQIGLGAEVADGSGLSVLQKLDNTLVELGVRALYRGMKSKIDVFAITMALMIGTAGLPYDCAILYCPKGFRICAQIRGLCTAIYRAFIHHRPCCRSFCAT